MAKQVTKSATPRLRFPEFRKHRAWEPTRLDSVLKFQAGFPFPSKGFSEEVRGLRLVRNRDLRSNEKPVYFVESHNPDFIVSDGDILVGMDGDFTPCVWSGGDALLNQRVGRVLPKAGNNKSFFLYFLTAQLKRIEDSTARTTVKHLSHSDVEKICEPLPSSEEQQKIADCLTSLDEVIAAQGRKVEALKAHKRGLMQQLFPREGETRPRLRFPEFRNAPEWREEPVSAVISTVSPPQKIPTSGYQPQGRLAIVDQSPDPVCGWTDDLGARVNAPLPLVVFGDHTCVLKLIEHDFAQGADGIKIISGKSCIDIRFLFYALQADPIVSTSYRRHFSLLQQKKVGFPKGMDEQRRIADCLASLDTRIRSEAAGVAALKAHKQGLMQQLFPAPEGRGA